MFGCLVLTNGAARADEGERIISGYGALGSFATGIGEDSTTEVGAALGVDFEVGLTEALWFRLSGGGGIYTGRPTSASAQASAGITFVFDVLRYVPYAHLGVGGVALYADETPGADDADTAVSLHPLIELGAGVDILSASDYSWGLHIRAESFVDRTALVMIGARLSYRWGFF